MTILHVSSGRLYGGLERMLTTLAEPDSLPQGVTFEFGVAAPGRLLTELGERNAVVHTLGDVRMRHPASVLRARRHLKLLLRSKPYAAAVCHAPWSHAIFGGVIRSCGVPLVLWQHDRATGAPLVERASRIAKADLVICNSHWTAASAASLQPGVPHRVIYCPVQAAAASDGARARIRSELGASSDDVVVLCASRIEPWKGHLDLISALDALSSRPWVLWIAGGGDRPHERAYREAIAADVWKRGLEPRVRLLGERRDVADLLAGADLLSQANVEPEPFGVVFAEALFAGVPVVTTGMGGAPEIVDQSCGRLVAPRDRAALTAALDELISNARLRASLGAAGPARAASRCDPSLVVPELIDALSSLRMPDAA